MYLSPVSCQLSCAVCVFNYIKYYCVLEVELIKSTAITTTAAATATTSTAADAPSTCISHCL